MNGRPQSQKIVARAHHNILLRKRKGRMIMKSHRLILSANKKLPRKSSQMLECALCLALLLVGCLNAQQSVELKTADTNTGAAGSSGGNHARVTPKNWRSPIARSSRRPPRLLG